MNPNKNENFKNIKTFVLDMDGTIYLGDSLFPFTTEFLNTVKSCGKDFCFFTNNSSKNRKAYIKKLKRMQIEISDEQMLISNGVIIEWLKKNHTGKSCYVVGTAELIADFEMTGINIDDVNPDIVILGFDTTLTYEKLSKACSFIRSGKLFFGVNADLNCPTEDGFIPDCGSMAALIAASTGVQCEFFVKPSPHTLDYILRHTGRKASEVAIIGDRLYTDIAVADKSEVTSILVLSGETQLSDLEYSEIKPDFVFKDLSEITALLNQK